MPSSCPIFRRRPHRLYPSRAHRTPEQMDPLTALVVIAFAIVAGLIGSLLGLGGGIVIIPALTLALGFNMQEAIGASLIGVIASSTGSASRYVQAGIRQCQTGNAAGDDHHRRVHHRGDDRHLYRTRRYWHCSSPSCWCIAPIYMLPQARTDHIPGKR